MEEYKYKRNYWPHAIIISIILIIIACIWTIIIALDNPVEMDSYYLEKYQQVDRNINDIIKKQKEFFSKYDIVFDTKKLNLDKPSEIIFSIIDKQTNKPLQKAEIIMLLTRPDSNKFNQEFKTKNTKNGKFIFENIVVNKPGRWQFKTKIKNGNFEGFHEYEVNATK